MNDLKRLEKLISGKKELDDLRKLYEEATVAAKTDESQFYKKMFKKSKNSTSILFYWSLDEVIRETEEKNKRDQGLISKLPRQALSLIKQSFDYIAVYPIRKCFELAKTTTDFIVFRPLDYIIRALYKINPFSSKN